MSAARRKLQISLPAWLDSKLREVLPAGRGYLSLFVEEAIKEKLEREGLLDEKRNNDR